jgi:hypothetical protein
VIRQIAKTTLRAAAAAVGPHRWRRGPSLLVLTYHRVLPDGHPARATEQPGMLVTPELLAMHVDVLRRHFTPVHLDDWLRASRAGKPPPGRCVAITFDDGWRDNHDHAFPVLQAARMPATIFLVTDMVGSDDRFWPNRLAHVLKSWQPDLRNHLDDDTRRRLTELGFPLSLAGHDATPERIDAVISGCKAIDDASMHALIDRLEELLPTLERSGDTSAERDLLSWNEVHAMAESRSHPLRFPYATAHPSAPGSFPRGDRRRSRRVPSPDRATPRSDRGTVLLSEWRPHSGGLRPGKGRVHRGRVHVTRLAPTRDGPTYDPANRHTRGHEPNSAVTACTCIRLAGLVT